MIETLVVLLIVGIAGAAVLGKIRATFARGVDSCGPDTGGCGGCGGGGGSGCGGAPRDGGLPGKR